MKRELVIYSTALLCLLLLTGCNVNVQMSPIELSMRKNMQEEIATSVASAITSQIPEIKKKLLEPTDKISTKKIEQKTNLIIVDLNDKPAGIKGAFHVSPNEFEGLTGQAELLDKKTPLLLYSTPYKSDIIQKATDKLHKLGFKQVGVYSGSPELIDAIQSSK